MSLNRQRPIIRSGGVQTITPSKTNNCAVLLSFFVGFGAG
jgi:hypothetical protein